MRLTAFLSRHSIILTLVLLLLTVPASGSDRPETRATLKGIKRVRVLVEDIGPEAERDGLTRSQIQTDVELRLRQSGITVVTSAPEYLYVQVNIVKLRNMSLYAVSINLEFKQHVSLIRDPKIFVAAPAITWNAGSTGATYSGGSREIRSQLNDLVDDFVNAYLEQNPKQ